MKAASGEMGPVRTASAVGTAVLCSFLGFALRLYAHGTAAPDQAALWLLDGGTQTEFLVDTDGIVLGRRRAAPWRSLIAGLRTTLPFAFDPAPNPAGVERRGAWWLVQGEASQSFLERWTYSSRRERWEKAFRLRLPWQAQAMAASKDGVWVGARRRGAVCFVRTTGRVELEAVLLGVDGVEALAAARDSSGGGVWIAAGGALARLDRRGDRMPGQGGFAHLVELRPVPAPHRSLLCGSHGTLRGR